MTLHSYDPQHGHGLRHDPLAAIIGPRPIGWISTVGADGVPNLAPYSFFNVFNYKPPIVAFSSVGHKDTVKNVQATGEFVYCLATRDLAEAVNASSAEVGPEVDEFRLVGLTPRASTVVRAPAVAESPVAMECKVLEVRPLQDLQGTVLDTWMVFGQVVQVHIDRRMLSGPDGTYETTAARPILRAGGPADYFEITEASRFRMFRPR
jgi:flavin reductase (DIM6/NTAB) family NADH-FMN oxidoreductase RutF